MGASCNFPTTTGLHQSAEPLGKNKIQASLGVNALRPVEDKGSWNEQVDLPRIRFGLTEQMDWGFGGSFFGLLDGDGGPWTFNTEVKYAFLPNKNGLRLALLGGLGVVFAPGRQLQSSLGIHIGGIASFALGAWRPYLGFKWNTVALLTGDFLITHFIIPAVGVEYVNGHFFASAEIHSYINPIATEKGGIDWFTMFGFGAQIGVRFSL